MTKGQIFGFIIFLAFFIGLFYFIQKSNSQKTTPPDLSLSQATGSLQYTQAPQQPNQQQVLPQATGPAVSPAMTLDDIKTASLTATIKTSKGDIVMELYGKDAPQTVQTFVTKAKTGFYNGLTFHRVEDWVIQGGDPLGTGTGGGSEPVEFNQKPFVVGSLGQASTGDGKVQNDSQFFITKKDASWLNGQYTNYGMVTKGMDVVNKIAIGDKVLGITIDENK